MLGDSQRRPRPLHSRSECQDVTGAPHTRRSVCLLDPEAGRGQETGIQVQPANTLPRDVHVENMKHGHGEPALFGLLF